LSSKNDNFRRRSEIQTDLFYARDFTKSSLLARTLDHINGCFGRGTLIYGAVGLKQHWRTRFEKRSPRYTTRWEEIPVVRG